MKTIGFTIIELLLVVAIISILGTFSVAFYSRFVQQIGVQTAADQIVGQYRRAQFLTVMGREDNDWGIHLSGTTLTLYSGPSFAARTPAFDETIQLNSAIGISGLSEVNFSAPNGLPSATPSITISGAGSTVSLSGNTQGVISP